MKRLIVCAVLAGLCLAGCTGCTETDTAPESSLPETTAVTETTEALTEPSTEATDAPTETEATEPETTETTETTEATEATEATTAAPADLSTYSENDFPVPDTQDDAPAQPDQSEQEAPAPTANITDDGVIEFPIIVIN